MMNSIRLIALTSLTAVVSLAPIAKADEWDKKTVLTVSETVQLPNATLQPGSYTFKLLDSQSDRHIVQVFDKDEKHLITTILAVPNYRLQPTGKTKFSFWEVPAGQPPALRAWFYPGDNFGQEFVYPKHRATELAVIVKEPIPALAADDSDIKSTPIIAVTPEQKEVPVAEVIMITPPPAEVAVAAPIVETKELPQTASHLPLIALLGFLSLGAALLLKRFSS